MKALDVLAIILGSFLGLALIEALKWVFGDFFSGFVESVICLFTKHGRSLLRQRGWMNSKYRKIQKP